MEVIFGSEKVGNAYRGVVIDSKSYKNVLLTAHTYQDSTIAKVAAQRTWEAQQQALAVQA